MPPSKAKPRSFTFTLSKADYQALVKLAEREGRSMANYLRHLIREGWRRRGDAR